MIDTIKAYLDLKPDTNPIPVSNFLSCLENPRNTEGSSSAGYLNGYLKNIKVSIQYNILSSLAYRLSFTGSIPKFLFGNNVATCFPSDVQTFIDTLSSAFDIDVSNAIVTWLDFGLNFSVTSPVPDYLQAIQTYRRLKKSTFRNESVTFQTKSQNWAITFYDKIKEIKSYRFKNKPVGIPEEVYDLDILRFEVRYRKQPHRKFKFENPIKLKYLSRNRFHKQLFTHLKSVFDEVEIHELKFPTTDLADRSGFLKTYLALMGLHECGYENVCHIIQSQNYNVKNQAVKRSTLKKQLKKQLKKLAQQSNELHSASIKTALADKFDALECIFS